MSPARRWGPIAAIVIVVAIVVAVVMAGGGDAAGAGGRNTDNDVILKSSRYTDYFVKEDGDKTWRFTTYELGEDCLIVKTEEGIAVGSGC